MSSLIAPCTAHPICRDWQGCWEVWQCADANTGATVLAPAGGGGRRLDQYSTATWLAGSGATPTALSTPFKVTVHSRVRQGPLGTTPYTTQSDRFPFRFASRSLS